MAVSKIPAIKAALEALFAVSVPLAGVRIARGAVDSERNKDEIVVGVARFEHAFMAMGRPSVLSETFRITVTVAAFTEGATDYIAPEARLWTLLDAVEDVIRTNHKAGGVQFENVTTGDQTYFLADKGKGAQAELTVAGKARITN